MIYLLNADLNGTDSIDFLIQAGYVVHMPIHSYTDFDYYARWLLQNAVPGRDTAVLDTINQMAYATRGDVKMGTDENVDLWDFRNKWLEGDSQSWMTYDLAGQLIMRRLRNLRNRGIRIITTAHQGDVQVDKFGAKKLGPLMNNALYQALRSATSDVFRMWQLPAEVNTGQQVYKMGTRIVQIAPSDGAVAKYHVDPWTAQNIPPNIPIESPLVPVLPTIVQVLKKYPSWLCLYGEQGVGKTTAAVSEAFAAYLQQSQR